VLNDNGNYTYYDLPLLANYDKFSTQFDRIIAIDWLGMGGSSRFRALPQAPLLWGSFQQAQAVDYFIDSLEVLTCYDVFVAMMI
jgi:pimeloyl-ACP methyl ester carboxylesterase